MNVAPIKNNLTIELHVPDFKLVKEFYGILGFTKITFEHYPSESEPGYLVLKRSDEIGDSMINFYGGNGKVYNQSYFKNFSKDTKRGYATELTITVSDIDEFYSKISPSIPKNIKQSLMEKTDQEISWHDFRIEDPFGFYLRFTELLDWGQK